MKILKTIIFSICKILYWKNNQHLCEWLDCSCINIFVSVQSLKTSLITNRQKTWPGLKSLCLYSTLLLCCLAQHYYYFNCLLHSFRLDSLLEHFNGIIEKTYYKFIFYLCQESLYRTNLKLDIFQYNILEVLLKAFIRITSFFSPKLYQKFIFLFSLSQLLRCCDPYFSIT